MISGPKNRGLIPGRDEGIFSSPEYPNQIWAHSAFYSM